MIPKIIKIGIIVLIIILGGWFGAGFYKTNSVVDNPKDLVETYVKYFGEGNYRAAVKLMTGELKKETDKERFIRARDKFIALYGKEAFSKVTVTVASITDSQAKILVKLNGMNAEDLTFNVVKEGKGWKIGK